jgi:hypothetical protein
MKGHLFVDKLTEARRLCVMNDDGIICNKIFGEELNRLDLSLEDLDALLIEERLKCKRLENQVDELSAEVFLSRI